ncbi:hypothetical protein [Pseudomonas sp. E102]|uniref:hypothetical protein n=1 Tax=Pseudomonas sp. E102 TaxID=181579 RepID=UPI004045C1EA
MSKQVINLGTAPTGVGGDTPRSAFTKAQSNFDELYAALGASGSPAALPAVIPIAKGGTGNATGTATKLAAAAMVGTVSQSGGVPTGAIIERGSNTNGSFVKFADGTMICWHLASLGSIPVTNAAGGVVYSVAQLGLPFPFPFAGSPSVLISSISSGGLSWISMGSALPTSSSTQNYFVLAPVAATIAITVMMIATGRWF